MVAAGEGASATRLRGRSHARVEPVVVAKEPVVVAVGEDGDRVVARFRRVWGGEAGEDLVVAKRWTLSPYRTRCGRRFLR